tara:strand:+ start:1146 stop:1823 length:678 start_codon:yes stop_codon:yes gene_type:complete
MASLTSFGKAILDHSNTSLTTDGHEGTKGLKVSYVGYDEGSERVVRSEPIERMFGASLSFDVRFHDNFQFVRGGKLHGLGPTRPLSGGNPMRDDGWSARLQFRAGGGLGVYVYHQDQGGTFGNTYPVTGFSFDKESWYNLDLRVWVNTHRDLNDGRIEVWVDKKRLLVRNNLRFRKDVLASTEINRFLFSTFHGGSSPAWAPKDENDEYTTVHATFDNFRIGKLR